MATIVNANTLKAKDDILAMVGKIKKLDQTPEQLERWLINCLGTDTFNVWLAFEGDRLVGVAGGQLIAEPYFEPMVVIHFAYIEPGIICGQELLGRLESWAKKKNVEKIIFFTKRHYRGFERKYGYKLERTMLIKRLNNESVKTQ